MGQSHLQRDALDHKMAWQTQDGPANTLCTTDSDLLRCNDFFMEDRRSIFCTHTNPAEDEAILMAYRVAIVSSNLSQIDRLYL